MTRVRTALVARIVVGAIVATAAGAVRAQAAEPSGAAGGRLLVDRVVVRFYAPETGGSSRPRFITERTLAFEGRLEAMSDGNPSDDGYQERYVRAAMDRHVAEEMLSTLQVEQGTEPIDLPRQVAEMRAGLEQRVGGPAALQAAARAEGIDDDEVEAFLRRRVRAAAYVDHFVQPILNPTDEQLREVFRTSAHPFKAMKFEDARAALLRWVIAERLRSAETTFLQGARTRVKVVVVTAR